MNDSFYKSIIKDSPMGYANHKMICDSEGKPCDYEFIEVNPAFEKIIGLKANDIIGKRLTEIFPDIKNCGFDWIGVYGNVALDGGIGEFDQFSEPLNKYLRVKAFSHKKNHFITLLNDISKETMEKKEKDINFKKLFDNMQSGCGIYEVKNDGKYGRDYIVKDFNKESLRIEGKTKEEVIGKSLYDIRPNIDEFGLIDDFREVWKTGIPKKVPAKLYTDEKFSSWYENNIFKLSSNEIVAAYNDVTEYKRAQAELVARDAKYNSMISNISDVIGILDENGVIQYSSPNTQKRFGWESNELIGIHALETVHPDDIGYVQKELVGLLKHPGASKTVEYRNKCKGGSYKYVHLSAVNLLNDNNINGILVNYHDITERIEKEKNFEVIIKTAMDGFLLFDLKANILDTNDSYCKLIGYTREELITMSLTDIKIFEENDDLEKLTYKTINESPRRYEAKHRHKNGTIIDVEISSDYLPDTNQFFVFLHDLTEEKRLEKEKNKMDAHLIRQQRLESIGTLAGGVAHEINNPINGIMNYGQLILDSSDAGSENAEYAKDIIYETERVAIIVKNLLQF